MKTKLGKDSILGRVVNLDSLFFIILAGYSGLIRIMFRNESGRHCLWEYGLMDLYGFNTVISQDVKNSPTSKTLSWYDSSMGNF